MAYSQKELDTMFAELPDDVKNAMLSIDTVKVLKGIQEKYKLHFDQIGDLSAEVGAVMIGVAQPQRFIANVQKALNVDKETAKNIATEVNEGIFKKVRQSLMKIHQMDEEKSYQDTKEEEKKVIPETTTDEAKKVPSDPYREAV